MQKVKISTITNRKFYRATSFRKYFLRGHRKYEQILIVEVENVEGKFCFELTNLATNVIERLDDPKTGTYQFPLVNGTRYSIVIRIEAAKGGYKIQKQTIKNSS